MLTAVKLGGTGADENGRYVLGDEALACLKDLRKWLKLYDDRTNRLDVARCLAESNVIEGDLLEILAAWPELATDDRLKSKIALACIELLVPLTWPIEKDDAQMTVNHHRHVPYLRQSQISYKRAILEHGSSSILRAAVRTALPSIALPTGERTTRDESIIKLLLYFFRNIAVIETPPTASKEGMDDQITRSSTIEAFHRQDVLALLLTVSSNIGEDFNTQDMALIEVLFHIVKGVNVEKLFMDQRQLSARNSDELKSLLGKEANMHRGYLRNAPSRHNRFGTMIWVKREGAGRVSTVSGQDVLKSGQRTLSKMDQSKKWNKPKQRSKDDEPATDRFDMPIALTEAARINLRSFVEEFLDSGFNPLFYHVRRAIEREAERVLESHKQQYFYLVAWFLEAERVRRRQKREVDRRKQDNKIAETFEPDSFGLISGVLTQEFFVLLNRFMQHTFDIKSWQELHAGMRCFTQILLLVQEMVESPVEEDQEIAENIQSRIFYEETTHDRIAAILRGFKDQGFGYLDACTELAHTFLRMLERYSRENVEMQVRSKRRARKTKKSSAKKQGQDDVDEDAASEMEDVREAERVSKERKFDFARFSSKFTNQACVDTFVALTKFYNDLNTDQLKRVHRFLYRVAFKQELVVMLLRLDIIALFYRIIKGPDALDPKNPIFKEWEELVRQVFRRLTKRVEQRPELITELLFSKIHSTVFYLEHGFEKQTIQSKPRAPAALEVKGSMSLDEQIGVIVAVLHEDHMGYIQWVSKTLSTAADERQSWEAEILARQENMAHRENPDGESNEISDLASQAPSIIITPPNEEVRVALFKNARLRLLMTLSGLERVGEDEPEATWMIPSSLTSSELRQAHDNIEKHRQDPKIRYGEDGELSAEDLLRRKPTEKAKRADYDDDSDAADSLGEEDFLFPTGGPTNTVISRETALENLKKKRRKRRSHHEMDDETREARRKARVEADLERRRAYKSELYIRESDEETDEERDKAFFAVEEARRLGQREKVLGALQARSVRSRMESDHPRLSIMKGAKRKAETSEDEEGGKRRRASSDASEVSDDNIQGETSPVTKNISTTSTESEDEDTPLSSPPHLGIEKNDDDNLQPSAPSAGSSESDSGEKLSRLAIREGQESDGDDVVTSIANRRRGRVMVFDDSDDE